METIFTYIISVTICLTVLFAVYEFLLKKETFFRLNRFLLLSVIFVSHLIPLLELPIITNSAINTTNVQQLPVVIENLGSEVLYAEQTKMGFETMFKYLLIAISALVLIKFLYSIGTIIVLIKQGHKEKKDRFILVYTMRKVSPFSFLNYIIVNRNDVDKSDMDKVIIHEYEHIKERHTLDLFIAEILLVFHWFNPIAYLLRKRLVMCHEYQADQAVVETTNNGKAYQEFLFNMIGTRNKYLVVNSLNDSLIKNRFVMMNKLKSQKMALIKYLAVLPLLAGLVFVFSCQKTTEIKPETEANIKEEIRKVIQPEGDEITELLKSDLGDAILLKEFRIELKPDEIQKYRMVLSKSTVYRFGIYDDPENDGDAELMLSDTISEMATSLNGKVMGNLTAFDLEIQKTGVYELFVKSKDLEGGSSRVVLAFVRNVKQ